LDAIYGYDNASRLASASDGTNSAAYTYLANSSLVGQIVYQQNGSTRMTTTKQYDHLNRLTSIASMPSLANFKYAYDLANQRTNITTGDGSYWSYIYDSLGQVTAGKKYWSDGTPVAGQQFDYTFDSIGNRTQTEAGGDATGANLRVANYTNNLLNQITSRDVAGNVDIMGIGQATNTIQINGLSPYRKGPYFREQLNVTNNSSAVWDLITASSPGQSNVTGHAYVAETPEQYTYDLDGNLLSDGRWNYTWDGENRLLSLTSLSGAPSGSLLQLNFGYDYMGRRIQKTVSTNGTSGYEGEYTNNFIYDGWNLIAELNPNASLIGSYLWGTDLSGSAQGAGGVGGLLAINLGTNGVHFVEYDGNGNVASLLNANNQTISAIYEYGPFGEVIRASGPMAKLNPFTFGTYFYDWETDKSYAKNRYYDPSTGRFLSRDPIEELSFRRGYLRSLSPKVRFALQIQKPSGNEFAFVQNDPEDKFDALGLCPSGTCDKWTITVLLMRSAGAEVEGLDVRTTLTAADSCCITPKTRYYRYLGYGLGVGVDWTVNYKVGSYTFSTPCIPWSAHNGIGRVTGVGGGIIWTYGLTYFTTPQAYFSIASPSYGFDASIFTTARYWWLEGN
jgi:RHS repeat-associated protein